MKAIYKMCFDCGRAGILEGVFIADTLDIKYLVNNKISIYFGEVLGRYSEVYGYVDKKEIKKITTDGIAINVVEKHGLSNGYNPFEYTLCPERTEGVPENGIDWADCTVQEYINFMRKGIVPKEYESEYNEFIKSKK